MDSKPKDWLVRTRTGEILGPFASDDLMDELQRKSFSAEDEIAPSLGNWISAQTLVNRENTEVTHTSTRTQTLSRSSVVTGSSPREASEPSEATLTPTPDFSSRQSTSGSRTPYPPIETEDHGIDPTILQKLGPILIALVIVFGVAAILLQLPAKKHSSSSTKEPPQASESESPFVKKIYSMIYAGETQSALQELAQYHDRRVNKDDVEYLVPYAALLILENEAPARAKKFLEEVLTSNTNVRLKSRAHHWLGYLLLSQDEEDMGESHFLEALELNPGDAAARFNLGRAYLKQERYSQALDYLQLAELASPDLWLVHIYKGTAKFKLENMPEAQTAFKTAVQSSPDRWLSYIYYAAFLMGIQEGEEARTTMRKMLTRDPGYEISAPPPFGFYQEKIDYSSYLKAYLQVMDKNTGEEREIGKLYINYLSNGPSGIEGKKIEDYAVHSELLTSRVLGLKILLDREARPEELKVAISRLPQSLNEFGYYAYVLRAQARVRLGLNNEAQQDLDRALQLEPRAAITHLTLAALLKRAHKLDEAQAEINTLLGYHPNYIPAIVSSRNF
jgi:tetratricopeptide (TPR) repeat protein